MIIRLTKLDQPDVLVSCTLRRRKNMAAVLIDSSSHIFSDLESYSPKTQLILWCDTRKITLLIQQCTS